MKYYLSSNDYYGALNRRFDCRMRKLHKIKNLVWDKDEYAFIRYGKLFCTGAEIMNMPNRVFYEFLVNKWV